MAQAPLTANERWRWIQFKQQIIPSDWIWEKQSQSFQNEPAWGFGERIEFLPKLNQNKCEVFGRNGLYLHEFMEFVIFISCTDQTDDVDLRMCYIPKSNEKRDKFLDEMRLDLSREAIYASFQTACRSYIWIFDICLVEMTFRDPMDKMKVITKKFHIHIDSGNCGVKSKDHFGWSPLTDELASYHKSGFLSKSELLSSISYAMESEKKEFVHVDFEFKARLELRPIDDDFHILEWDSNCNLGRSEPYDKNMIQSIKLINSLSPFLACSLWKARPKFFEMDFDITFEVDSNIMRAHSWILAAGSPVFFKMITTDMLEKKTGIIKLDDATAANSLKIFLTHLYRSKGYSYMENYADQEFSYADNWTAEISFKILQLAHKYQVSDLIDFCVENIISRPDSEFTLNLAVQIFKGGMLYNIDDLKCRSGEWIKRQSKQAKRELNALLTEESNALLCEFILYLA